MFEAPKPVIVIDFLTRGERQRHEYETMKSALEQALNIANTPGVEVEVKYKGIVDVVWEALDRCFGAM